MPRLNVERTHEKRAWDAHEAYIKENFPDRSVNYGWCQDGFSITSKVYGEEPMVVTTSLTPPYPTGEEPY